MCQKPKVYPAGHRSLIFTLRHDVYWKRKIACTEKISLKLEGVLNIEYRYLVHCSMIYSKNYAHIINSCVSVC